MPQEITEPIKFPLKKLKEKSIKKLKEKSTEKLKEKPKAVKKEGKKINEKTKEKLLKLNPPSDLQLLKSVTHKFVRKLPSPLLKPADLKKSDLKKALKSELQKTDHILLNNEKIRVEFNHPLLTETIFFCNKCLKSFYSSTSLNHHSVFCTTFYGNLSYSTKRESNDIEIRQIDGSLFSRYAHTLTKIGRYFFIDKSLDSLLEYFYLFTLVVNNKLVGYFSMDKLFRDCNISCIVVFPPYRGFRYGYLLIDFSYRIFQLNGKVAAPERPLSKGGEVVFLRYWKFTVATYLRRMKGEAVSVKGISQATGIEEGDVRFTLERIIENGSLKEDEIPIVEVLKSGKISLMLET